ncbi:MAG: leucine-rich repeat domain-containing protein [Muribaculaceae bacterium]|nr:leucine-rich repeat domain-containing protein [Muribaculaceae bacterium]
MTIAFPDENFRSYVLMHFVKNIDGVITEEEALSVKKVYLAFEKSISSLEGIQYFKNLEILECYNFTYHQLTTLDVSKNTALTTLECYENQLTTLDVSKNTSLTTLNCGYNQLTTLDVSGCPALTELRCQNNQLTTLDVSGCTALTALWCGGNQLTTLDVSKNTSLTELQCPVTLKTLYLKSGQTIQHLSRVLNTEIVYID